MTITYDDNGYRHHRSQWSYSMPKLLLLFFLFLWVASVLGMTIMLWKKFHALAQIPAKRGSSKTQPLLPLPQLSIRGIFLLPLKSFSFRKLTEKSLAKFHIFILRTENTIRALRERLRRRPLQTRQEDQEHRRQQKDSGYWERLKRK